MRTFLLAVFWITNVGSGIQLLVVGTIIGFWAYSEAKRLPVGPAYT